MIKKWKIAAFGIASLALGERSFSYDVNEVSDNIEDIEPNGKWQLFVQKTGQSEDITEAFLILVEPDGAKNVYPVRSGGFEEGALPGLNEKLSDSEEFNAFYEIDYNSFIVDSNDPDFKSAFRGEDGLVSWLRLGSFENQTERGGVIGVDYKGFFGIHYDGDTNDDGILSDGTEGCLAGDQEHIRDFMKQLQTIPKDQRPEIMFVLEPKEPDTADTSIRFNFES